VKKIICVVSARPNFVKIAPIIHAFRLRRAFDPHIVHTGQHYDEKMSDLFFRELEIPKPNVNLGVGGGSHAVQTAQTMLAFEKICLQEKPDAVLVVGDVNGTVACGLVAVKLGVKLIHVEAGLRSFDRSMPEEINRIVVDSISDVLFCTEKSGLENLKREGTPDEKVFLVGNVMIDSLLKNREKAEKLPILEDLGLRPKQYATLTLHRPAAVDNPDVLNRLFDAFERIQRDMPILFPVHPRTKNNLDKFGLTPRLEKMKNIRLLEPQGYLEFLKLNANALLVFTDSGGLQEETTILKTPCVTLRENTERPCTCEVGSNRLVGLDPQAILDAYAQIRAGKNPEPQTPPFWDGKAAERIAEALEKLL